MKSSRKHCTNQFSESQTIRVLVLFFPLTQTRNDSSSCSFYNFEYIDIVCALRLYFLLFYGKINTRRMDTPVYLPCKLYKRRFSSVGLHFHFSLFEYVWIFFFFIFCYCWSWFFVFAWVKIGSTQNISCQFSASCIKLSEQLVHFIRQKSTQTHTYTYTTSIVKRDFK